MTANLGQNMNVIDPVKIENDSTQADGEEVVMDAGIQLLPPFH